MRTENFECDRCGLDSIRQVGILAPSPRTTDVHTWLADVCDECEIDFYRWWRRAD